EPEQIVCGDAKGKHDRPQSWQEKGGFVSRMVFMDLRAQGFACRGLTRLIGLPGKEKTGQGITPYRRIDLPGFILGLPLGLLRGLFRNLFRGFVFR
ncbi:MAG: hypothetical protein VW989_15690, partial [Rhodobiaceae bacterium]